MPSKLCLSVLLSEKFIFDKRAKFHLSVDKQSLNNSNLNYIFCPIFLTKEQKSKKLIRMPSKLCLSVLLSENSLWVYGL